MSHPVPLQTTAFIKKQGAFALGPIDLTLESGYIYALVGANGAGKTTLLKCLAGLSTPSSGDIRIFGTPVADMEQGDPPVKTKIAFVPDPLDGCEAFTLREMGRIIGKWYSQWSDAELHRLADALRVPIDKPYGQLSQGSRKKAALALAFTTRAQLLLLDEPSGGLDLASRSLLYRLLADNADDERTVLLATHSPDDIRQLADFVIVLRDGVISGPYEKDELLQSWRTLWLAEAPPRGFTGIPGAVDWAAAPMPFIVSSSPAATIAWLAEQSVGIVKEQALPLDELLNRLTGDA